jgi:hypothetical protein
MTEFNDILESEILRVVENFILAGNIKITLIKQSDGNWTVIGE